MVIVAVLVRLADALRTAGKAAVALEEDLAAGRVALPPCRQGRDIRFRRVPCVLLRRASGGAGTMGDRDASTPARFAAQ